MNQQNLRIHLAYTSMVYQKLSNKHTLKTQTVKVFKHTINPKDGGITHINIQQLNHTEEF